MAKAHAVSEVEDTEVAVDGDIEHPLDDVEILTKLTVATVGGMPAMAKSLQQRVPIAVFWGRASETAPVEDPEDKSKVYTSLRGVFKAVNLQTGRQFASGVMYLHDAFQKRIVDEIAFQTEEMTRKQKPFRGVEFIFQIDAIPQGNISGYSYSLKSLMPPSHEDPLRLLTERTFTMLHEAGFDLSAGRLPAPSKAA